jgi:hypothetical protein
MSVIKLPAVAVSILQSSPPYISPKTTVAGGLIAMLFNLSGKAYKLIGFGANFSSNITGSGPVIGGNSTSTDGVVRMPIQILILPSLDPIASGILELYFLQNGTSGPGPAFTITGNAELRGFIIPGITQAIAVFNIPNTVSFSIVENIASLIVETLEGD